MPLTPEYDKQRPVIVWRTIDNGPFGSSRYSVSTSSGRDVWYQSSYKGNHKTPTYYRFDKRTYDSACFSYRIAVPASGLLPSGQMAYYRQIEEGIKFIPRIEDFLPGGIAEARNASLESLSEMVRGQLDLSIDAMQFDQTMKLKRQASHMIGETFRLLRSCRHALGPSLKKARSRGRFDWRKPPKLVSDAWLAWVYGVKPTMQSIYDTGARLLTPEANDYVVGLSSTGSSTNTFNKTTVLFDGETRKEVMEADLYRSVRCRHSCQYSTKAGMHLQRMAGYTSLNPISMAYELCPYSFVVDWVYNIGGYLRVLETSLLYSDTLSKGCETITTLDVVNYSVYGTNGTQPDTSYTGYGRGKQRRVTLERNPFSGFPLPSPPVLTLGNLGSGRLLNAAALLGTLLRSK